MNQIIESLIHHGVLILFLTVFVDQMGLPIPAIPFLLAAGSLAGAGKLNLALIIAVSFCASILADVILYYLGRTKGNSVLGLLCRIALEPDICIRRTQDVFTSYGMKGVFAGKFVPGLNTLMPPLAGIFGVSFNRFLLIDGLAALLYAGGYTLIGLIFSRQLEQILNALASLGSGAVLVVAGLLGAYIAYKYWQRWRFRRQLREARMTVDELHQRQSQADALYIVDLRSSVALAEDPVLIAGAVHFAPQDLESRHHEIPRDRDVVLYCSCPNEATSVKTALRLKKRGITRVRPLVGGLDAWRERNYPVQTHPAAKKA
jgi:membrane protein DedA with SNARE-associated domain/rhodanese-related sulfurtransferase